MTAPEPGLWRTILEALRGAKGHDYTKGPVGRSLLLLAVPMVLELALESVFAVVNGFWVNRLGATAVATIGLVEGVMPMLFALSMGLAIAATATVARRIGEKNPDGAASVAVQAVLLGVLGSVPLGVLGAFFAPEVLTFMGAEAEVLVEGTTYARVLLGGSGTILMLFMINAIFRGAGDAAVAMRCLWLANAVNLVLDPLLIFGLGPLPKLGVTGAAVATTIARGLGVAWQIHHLLGRGRRFQIESRHLRVHGRVMLDLMRLARSSIVQMLVATTSWSVLMKLVGGFGSVAVASYSSSVRVFLFALLPAWGLSNASTTMVGQSLGAGDPRRAVAAVRTAALYNVVCLSAVGVLLALLAPSIASAYVVDPEVARRMCVNLRLLCASYPFFACGMVFASALNGAGDSRTGMRINLLCFWLWEIPLAWLLAEPLGLETTGVCAAIVAGLATYAVVGGLVFRLGRWQKKRV